MKIIFISKLDIIYGQVNFKVLLTAALKQHNI